MFKKKLFGAVVGAAIMVVGAQASVIPNDFDSEHGGVAVLNYDGFADYTVTAGSVDLIGNGYFDVYSGNGLYVDLAGTTSQFGALTTKAVYGPGKYLVSVGLGGPIYAGINDGAILSWNSGSTQWDLLGLDSGTYTAVVTLASASEFTIADAGLSGNPDVGATFFGLTVTPVSNAPDVPEPLTLSLMGAGLLGAFGWRRSRKSA